MSSEGPPATLVTPSDTPIPAKPPSMLKSKSGWAAVGLGAFGGSGVLDQLQQANDYASQISMAKFNLHELDVGAVLHWFVAHPAALLPILVIGAAAFVWEDHRKYKRLLMEAQRK